MARAIVICPTGPGRADRWHKVHNIVLSPDGFDDYVGRPPEGHTVWIWDFAWEYGSPKRDKLTFPTATEAIAYITEQYTPRVRWCYLNDPEAPQDALLFDTAIVEYPGDGLPTPGNEYMALWRDEQETAP